MGKCAHILSLTMAAAAREARIDQATQLRCAFVAHMEQGMTVAQVMRLLGVCRNTVKKWWGRHQQGGRWMRDKSW